MSLNQKWIDEFALNESNKDQLCFFALEDNGQPSASPTAKEEHDYFCITVPRWDNNS